MDDLISGCSSISSAKQLKQELISLFSRAGMQLHKWSSNCIELLYNFDVLMEISLTIPDETKTLGFLWRPQKDTLAFSVPSIADVSDSCTITKSSVLSATARIFDSLGLISPVVTKAKLVMQELWRLKLDWNDSLPIHLETQWKRFVKSLAAINNLNIPRYILLDDALRKSSMGVESTIANIRSEFWIINCRNQVRKVLKNCISCLKVNAKAKNEVMADLPSNRVKVSRVFTKAIHLEIVTNCSTGAFLGALKRFISRRGKPHDIFSDNGTNFVGANNELKKILQNLFIKEGKEKIENFIASEGIVWHFNPPATPHFGGLWEAGIKSLKSHLKRVI
ncbi:integrase catalytic domain-containing protein, partial [Trichonephila clavata]